MKLPNSYGSVIKLGGKRRKPYAVRISKLVEDDTGKVKRKYTYLAYTYGTYMNGNFNTCMGKLKGIMETIYANISDAAKRYNATVGGQTDYVAGANIAGFEKVVEAMLAQGVC